MATPKQSPKQSPKQPPKQNRDTDEPAWASDVPVHNPRAQGEEIDVWFGPDDAGIWPVLDGVFVFVRRIQDKLANAEKSLYGIRAGNKLWGVREKAQIQLDDVAPGSRVYIKHAGRKQMAKGKQPMHLFTVKVLAPSTEDVPF